MLIFDRLSFKKVDFSITFWYFCVVFDTYGGILSSKIVTYVHVNSGFIKTVIKNYKLQLNTQEIYTTDLQTGSKSMVSNSHVVRRILPLLCIIFMTIKFTRINSTIFEYNMDTMYQHMCQKPLINAKK